jgi:two-component system sensor histidine kinase/response regulator
MPNTEKIKGSEILLVDDNTINQEVAREFLENVGVVVTIAANGQECLDVLREKNFDLVLMDIQMPVMDGLEATRRIRQDSQLKSVPIIAMTAHAMDGDREKSLAAGMNEHITKPIDQAKLYQTLKNWIAEKALELPPSTLNNTTADLTADQPLPFMPGINQEEALKVLNHNKKLFLKMLYDFKKHYSTLPDILRELGGAGQWQEIQNKAHTIKGVSGYIGSFSLMNTAQELEDALRNDHRRDAAYHLNSFIKAFEEVLSTLSVLPSLQEEKPSRTNTKPITIAAWGKEVVKMILLLEGQLKRGEAAAEDQFMELRKRLSGTGFDGQIETIADLIDDIEYERAADMTAILLKRIQQQLEN